MKKNQELETQVFELWITLTLENIFERENSSTSWLKNNEQGYFLQEILAFSVGEEFPKNFLTMKISGPFLTFHSGSTFRWTFVFNNGETINLPSRSV